MTMFIHLPQFCKVIRSDNPVKCHIFDGSTTIWRFAESQKYPQFSSILMGFSHINHPFGVPPFWETTISATFHRAKTLQQQIGGIATHSSLHLGLDGVHIMDCKHPITLHCITYHGHCITPVVNGLTLQIPLTKRGIYIYNYIYMYVCNVMQCNAMQYNEMQCRVM